MHSFNNKFIFAGMILVLHKEDFSAEHLPMVMGAFQAGFKNKNYTLVDSKHFANVIVYNMGLQNNPHFRLPMGMDCEYNRIANWVEQYELLMLVND